jgi:hypothetical protein
MTKKRYKIRKEQLEKVVENFVMESAAPEAKKHVKGSLGDKMVEKRSNTKDAKTSNPDESLSHAPEAKKHKMSMGAEQSDDMGDGMEMAPEMKTTKMKQAPEAKKHVKGSVTESEEMDMEEGRLGKFLGTDKEGLFMDKLEDLKSKGYKVYTRKHKSDDEMIAFAKSHKFDGKLVNSTNFPEGKAYFFKPESEIKRGSATSAGLSHAK